MLERLRWLPLWWPLEVRSFRRLFLGESVSLLADQTFFVTLTLLVVQTVGPGFALGSVLAVAAIPGAVLMPLGGALTDRFGPAPMMMVSSVGRFCLLTAVATLVLLDSVSLWHLYLFGGLLSTLDAIYYPASLSAVPTVIGKDGLPAANALLQGAEQTTGMIGPAVAAFAVAAVGFGVTFGANALLFVASTLAFWSVFRILRGHPSRRKRKRGRARAGEDSTPETPTRSAGALPTPPADRSGISGLGALFEGVRYVWEDPLLRALISLLAVINLAAIGPVVVGGAVLSEERLGGASAFGIMLSAYGAGALVGLLVAGSASRPRRRGPALLAVTVLLGLGLAALGFVPSLPWAMAAVALMGVGGGYLGVVLVAWIQERVQDRVRGRVMALVSFAYIALDPVSYTLTGVLLELGLTLTFAVAGTVVVLAALLGAASRAVRKSA